MPGPDHAAKPHVLPAESVVGGLAADGIALRADASDEFTAF
jgi:hypothetical protein